MLIQAPKTAKGTTIHGGGMAAAVAGTTILFEYHPAVYKILVLEGTSRLYRPGHLGDSIVVRAGQLVIGDPNKGVSDPVDFDVERMLKTCRFITDFPPLPSEKLMAQAIEKQQRQKAKKTLIDTNLIIFGGGSVVSVVAPVQTGARSQFASIPAALMPCAGPVPDDLGTIEPLASLSTASDPTVSQ